MKRSRRLACSLLSVSLRSSLAGAQPPRPLEKLFYHTDTEDSFESFVKHADRITIVAPGAYHVDSLGIVWGQVDRRVMEIAKRHNVKVMPLLINEGFHQPSLRRLLADTAARNRATRTMAALCRSEGYWGWQFDIENVPIGDRDRLTAWYREASDALHRAGCTISIAVVHRPGEEAGTTAYHRFLFDSWRGGYDLEALGRASDFVTIMSYSQHTRRTPPGPQAGLPWARAVADHFLRYIPAEKLSLGVATQSMHWYTREDNALPERARSWAQAISHRWATGLAERHGAELRWDEKQGVTYGFYESGGTFEWLFVEDARSFQARLALAREKRLRGISVWVLGPEDERIWDALR